MLFIGIMIARQSFGQNTSVDSTRCFTPAQEKRIIADLILFQGCKEDVVILNAIVKEQEAAFKTQDSLITECNKTLDVCDTNLRARIKEATALRNQNQELLNKVEQKNGVIRALTTGVLVLVAIVGTAAYFIL